ncbi:hypothetical protein [Streptomyces sp. NPDC050355]|uniref:hypothetical protein n=1 Tax=Streptomyces sp. NPDC050355 TaxID=3365609 RepID=UPI0037A87646
MTLRHPVSRGGEGRGRFAELAEKASLFTSSPAFFVACLALVGLFVASTSRISPSRGNCWWAISWRRSPSFSSRC